MHKTRWLLGVVALALGVSAGCSKQTEGEEPSASASAEVKVEGDVDVDVEEQEGPDRNLFEKAWDGMAEVGDDVQDVGEWSFQKAQDGSVVAWRKTKEVATQVDEETRDAALLTRVKARLGKSRKADATEIDVNVTDGVVTLKGRVDSATEAREAVEITARTRGVQRVVSYLSWG